MSQVNFFVTTDRRMNFNVPPTPIPPFPERWGTKMIPCSGNKIPELDYHIIQYSICLKYLRQIYYKKTYVQVRVLPLTLINILSPGFSSWYCWNNIDATQSQTTLNNVRPMRKWKGTAPFLPSLAPFLPSLAPFLPSLALLTLPCALHAPNWCV